MCSLIHGHQLGFFFTDPFWHLFTAPFCTPGFTPTGILMGNLCGSPMGPMGNPHGAHVGPHGCPDGLLRTALKAWAPIPAPRPKECDGNGPGTQSHERNGNLKKAGQREKMQLEIHTSFTVPFGQPDMCPSFGPKDQYSPNPQKRKLGLANPPKENSIGQPMGTQRDPWCPRGSWCKANAPFIKPTLGQD